MCAFIYISGKGARLQGQGLRSFPQENLLRSRGVHSCVILLPPLCHIFGVYNTFSVTWSMLFQGEGIILTGLNRKCLGKTQWCADNLINYIPLIHTMIFFLDPRV